ncbi:MAG: Hsp20/alpha crystallin family protein [Syntrophales bacterium]|nr:Hsp20/alpha crystallin family protein [Syntrophales bacterium]MDY0044063.1 Hsp20/alpha crystallin family protein [Syntrophales bacterium]
MAWNLDFWRPVFGRPARFGGSEDMDRMVDWALRRWPERRYMQDFPYKGATWQPPLDLYEKEDRYTIRMELPGTKLEDVDITMRGNTLLIKGERRGEEGVKDEEYEICEICYGSFSRSLILPEAVNADQIEATMSNGILNINVPKSQESQHKKIEIKTSQ